MSNPTEGRLELLVKDLTPADMSNYTCLSNNKAGFHERNGTITVNCKCFRIIYLQHFFIHSFVGTLGSYGLCWPVIHSTSFCLMLV